MNSPMVSYIQISPNRNSPREHAIDRITIHCTKGQMTPEIIGDIFVKPERQASSNYGVGYDGRVGMYVEEGDRSWCSSSRENDHRAVTIEVSSDDFPPYAVGETAFAVMLDLCEEICRRHGKKKLVWLGDKERTLAYEPAEDEMLMTVHCWFSSKTCPGEHLLSRHPYIAREVTRRLTRSATR